MIVSRRNVVLASVLAVLVAGRLFLSESDRAAAVSGPLLPGFDVQEVARIRLTRGSSGVELVRDEGDWVVVERERFPAFAPAVEELLRRLPGLSTRDRVAGEEASHELYGLGGDATRVELTGAGGERIAAVLVGRPEDLARGTYVRRTDSDEVYRAPGLSLPAAEPVRWLDTRILDFDPAEVEALHARWRDGAECRLVRLEDGRWRSVGESRLLAGSDVNRLLLQAANLYFQDVLGVGERERHGLDPARVSLTLELGEGARRELLLGEPEEGGTPVTNPFWSAAWVALLPAQSARRLEAALDRLAAGE